MEGTDPDPFVSPNRDPELIVEGASPISVPDDPCSGETIRLRSFVS